jgi:hypothetical protein
MAVDCELATPPNPLLIEVACEFAIVCPPLPKNPPNPFAIATDSAFALPKPVLIAVAPEFATDPNVYDASLLTWPISNSNRV